MFDVSFTTVAALSKAWTVTMIAITVLMLALALSAVWNSSDYLHNLQRTMTMEEHF